MNILVVTTVRFRLNGITSVIMNYYRNMDKTGMQIDFVVPNEISEEYKEELNRNGSVVYHIPRNRNPLAYQSKVYRVLKENKYDMIHIHGNSAMMVIDLLPAVLAGTKVRIVHSHNTTCSHRRLHNLLYPLFRRMYTHGIACGEDAGRWLFREDDFLLLKNGIDLNKYRYNDEIRSVYREKLQAGDKLVIGHVGNFIEQKNHSFLLDFYEETVKKNPNCLLVLISDGALMDAMKEKAETLGIGEQVLFLGKTLEVAEYLQAMDLFVLPSLHEGLPVVLVEAQASGLYCLVSDKVAKEADLTDRMTYLPIDSVDSWNHAIEQISSDMKMEDRQERCEIFQERIRERGYDVTANADRMKQAYERFLSESSPE